MTPVPPTMPPGIGNVPTIPRYRVVFQIQGTIMEAKRRYWMDHDFHHVVDLAVLTMEREHGVKFDQHDLTLATEAAAMALLVLERVSW